MCAAENVTFDFCGTGWRFVKDGRLYRLEEPGRARDQARRSGLSFEGKPALFKPAGDAGTPDGETGFLFE